jgi:hypothetical protein
MVEVCKGLAWILLGGGITMLIPTDKIAAYILIEWAIAFYLISRYLELRKSRLTSLRDAIHDSRCVWGFWYSGEQVLIDKAIRQGETTSVRKMILLKPDLNNDAFNYITSLAGEDTPVKRGRVIGTIKSLMEVVSNSSTKVSKYYHSECLTYAFTIYDKTPQSEGDNLLPNSPNAWIVVQPLEPKRASERKDWHKWVVKNRGNSKEQFKAYYDLFTDIEKRSELIAD